MPQKSMKGLVLKWFSMACDIITAAAIQCPGGPLNIKQMIIDMTIEQIRNYTPIYF